mgnify:CR=1 FL=1
MQGFRRAISFEGVNTILLGVSLHIHNLSHDLIFMFRLLQLDESPTLILEASKVVWPCITGKKSQICVFVMNEIK